MKAGSSVPKKEIKEGGIGHVSWQQRGEVAKWDPGSSNSSYNV